MYFSNTPEFAFVLHLPFKAGLFPCPTTILTSSYPSITIRLVHDSRLSHTNLHCALSPFKTYVKPGAPEGHGVTKAICLNARERVVVAFMIKWNGRRSS